MNARQENKLTNYLSRKALLDTPESVAITGAIPALTTALGDWNGSVALLQTLGNKQGANLTGIAQAKRDLRLLMAKRALVVRNKLRAFAHVSGNAELTATVDIDFSEIVYESRDTEADDFAIRILEAAQANEAAMADYGLTAAQIDDLESAIEGYSALIGKPLAAINSRKTTTEQLDAEFRKADATLENVIDPLIFSLELEQPEFVAAYRNATAINDMRAGSKDAEPAPPTA